MKPAMFFISPEELTKPMIEQMFGSEAGIVIIHNVQLNYQEL